VGTWQTPRRWHRWLLLLPFIWQVGFVPLVNDITWRPLSLPFPMVWQMAGVILATLVIAVVFAIDRRFERVATRDLDRDNA